MQLIVELNSLQYRDIASLQQFTGQRVWQSQVTITILKAFVP
jgi:hypothetical protein